MSEPKFMSVPGQFICKTCKEVVKLSRFYFDTGTTSWMCTQKHLSRIDLIPTKRKKKDFSNE